MPEDFDNEIEILDHPSPAQKAFLCQFCHLNLAKQTEKQRQAHYEGHLGDECPASDREEEPSSSKRHSDSDIFRRSRGSDIGLAKLKEEGMLWLPSQESTPPPNFSPGLITILRRSLLKSHSTGQTTRAVLCYERAIHIGPESFDRSWGCGYRNFLMACAALMDQPFQPMYFPLLNTSPPPSVRSLQLWIEDAWREGYDPDGARELKNHLVNTNKWVGTAELYVAFVFRGIPAKLVDFDFKRNSAEGAEKLLNWVVNYFTACASKPSRPAITIIDALRGASAVSVVSRALPIVLQHAGHSRTIIGYEVDRKGKTNLLIFDPSKYPSKHLRNAGLAAYKSCPRNSLTSPAADSEVYEIPDSPENRPTLGKRRISDLASWNRAPKISYKSANPGPHTRMNTSDAISLDDSSNDDDVELISHKEVPKTMTRDEESLRPSDVVSFFRLSLDQLRRKDQYQILYFPLDDPLNATERAARKEVRSTKIS